MDLNAYCRTYGTAGEVDETPVRHLAAKDFLALIVRGFPVNPPAMTVRSDALAAAGLWNENIRRSEDFELGLRLAMSTDLLLVDEPLTIVRRHDAHGDLADYALAAYEADFAALLAHLKHISSDAPLAKVLGRRFLGMARTFRRRGRTDLAVHACRIALTLPGNRFRALAGLTKSILRWPQA